MNRSAGLFALHITLIFTNGATMKLTAYEQEMLDGVHGEGYQLAMEVLVRMGELYGAERFIPVKNAHIDAAAYTTIWDAGTEFLEFLADHGVTVPQPTTINPISRDIRRWKELGATEEFAMKSKRMEDAYLRMGVNPTWTCAPYQCGNLPRFGEVVSWSESNAVNFVNSVVGARAERLPDLMDVCCAVCGRVPEYGRYITENRRGDMLFELEGFDDTWFRDPVDYALLGYHIGEIAVAKNPVIKGLPDRTQIDDIKAFSAAAASGGAVSLFHIVGFTPEAPTLEAAFQGWRGYETYKVTPEDLIRMKAKLDTADSDEDVSGHVDMVLIGCPHASFEELRQIAELMGGRKVSEGTDFWITTSDTQYQLARRAGVADVLKAAGVTIACDTCVMEMEEGERWKGQTFVTNSGKVAQYAPGINQVLIKMASTAGCVEAAVTGMFPEEVH